MEIKHALVTGGGGFLGKAIVKKLLKKNMSVTSFSRSFYPELENMGVMQIQGDIANKDAVIKAFNEIDVVYHVAANAGMWAKYDAYYNANVIGTQNVIAACFKNKIKQLIYTSSPSVIFNGSDQENIDESVPYPDSYSAPYPETKAMAERKVVKASQNGLSAIILRPHIIWGPEDNHLLPRIIKRAKKLKRFGKKEYLMDTIYIDNAADVHILASKRLMEDPALSGNIYFVSQDEPVNIWGMVDDVLNAAGLPPVKGQVSVKTVTMAATIFEFVYRLFNIKSDPPLTRFGVEGLSKSHWFNISKAKKDLGYYPKVSTQEGLKRLKQWFLTVE
ncbi:MAG: SDR family NAD(P)-dependent oxidoreductase [Desulfobacteraceae bacterium]|nr:SDR family NAD(P)-dependent oxidoreductase [Desulfobacteraceae bacterium]